MRKKDRCIENSCLVETQTPDSQYRLSAAEAQSALLEPSALF
jgi:hypothetical protein